MLTSIAVALLLSDSEWVGDNSQVEAVLDTAREQVTAWRRQLSQQGTVSEQALDSALEGLKAEATAQAALSAKDSADFAEELQALSGERSGDSGRRGSMVAEVEERRLRAQYANGLQHRSFGCRALYGVEDIGATVPAGE
jgi:multidrug resistance efflux pump